MKHTLWGLLTCPGLFPGSAADFVFRVWLLFFFLKNFPNFISFRFHKTWICTRQRKLKDWRCRMVEERVDYRPEQFQMHSEDAYNRASWISEFTWRAWSRRMVLDVPEGSWIHGPGRCHFWAPEATPSEENMITPFCAAVWVRAGVSSCVIISPSQQELGKGSPSWHV